jgi:hypothetical protein
MSQNQVNACFSGIAGILESLYHSEKKRVTGKLKGAL